MLADTTRLLLILMGKGFFGPQCAELGHIYSSFVGRGLWILQESDSVCVCFRATKLHLASGIELELRKRRTSMYKRELVCTS